MTVPRRAAVAGWLAAAVIGGAVAPVAVARENLETERALGSVMMQEEPHAADAEAPKARTWALLPQIGYSPDRGVNAGLKFVHRDLGARRLTLDVDGVYAMEGQQKYQALLVGPELGPDWLVGLLEAKLLDDPRKEFFGIGNNETGPEPISTNGYRLISTLATIGGRPWPRLTLAATIGFTDVDIDRGEIEDEVPSTVDRFPRLTGIRGGRTSPVSFSVVFNNREDVTRPTRGWSFTAKAQHVSRALGNDFRFTRYVVDASYLWPVIDAGQVVGIRVGGEFLDAKRRQVPFWELASLGGAQDLRGFFSDRFLGRSRVMINAEGRRHLAEFDFLDWWHVRIDGVLFGDMGRVFVGNADLENEFELDPDVLPRVFRDFRYSGGFGFRIALGQALTARLDVGFSDEEQGLAYLTFGHMF